MSGILRLLIALLLFLPVLNGYAQDGKQKKKESSFWDAFKLKKPERDYPAPDTSSEFLFTEKKLNDSLKTGRKGPVVLREDTIGTLDNEALDIVRVSEDLRVDCVWVTSSRYYSIWDSENVNPYEFDGTDYKDTLEIRLYNEEEGRVWAMPLKDHSKITSEFGRRWYRWHYGIDLRVDVGDTVRAAFDGIVRISKVDPNGYGYYVMLRHPNGLETLYGHLSKPGLEVGQEVEAGEMIGLAGNSGSSTGPHLHFEVRFKGNAIDPARFYDFEKDTLEYKFYTLKPEDFSYLEEARKTIVHQVRRGDNLTRISRKYGVPVWKICRWNNISRNSVLHVGQRLRVR